MNRKVIGLMLAPAVGLLVGVVMVNLANPGGYDMGEWGAVHWPTLSLVYAMWMTPMAYAGMFAFGWPASNWLNRRGIYAPVVYTIIGIAFGVLTPALLFDIAWLFGSPLPGHFVIFPLGFIQPGVVGGATGYTFWAIAIRKRGGITAA